MIQSLSPFCSAGPAAAPPHPLAVMEVRTPSHDGGSRGHSRLLGSRGKKRPEQAPR